ncbi:MAG: ATP-dependent protease ATPase subunit HslU [Candidatus Bruticola sp.]
MSSDDPQNFDELFQRIKQELHGLYDMGENPAQVQQLMVEAVQDMLKQSADQSQKFQENIKACQEAISSISPHLEAEGNTSSSSAPQFLFGADLEKFRQEMEKKQKEVTKVGEQTETADHLDKIGLSKSAEPKKEREEDDHSSTKAESKADGSIGLTEKEKNEPKATETDESKPDFTAYPLENLFSGCQGEDHDRADKINLDDQLTPRQVVEALDRYIVGQEQAKKAVAISLRNRYRREKLQSELREEIIPKNILMVGPTGVGKTEIARRLAKLMGAPFLKVEATKYTEVGYVGRDVESMIRDLALVGMRMVERERLSKVKHEAREAALARLLDSLQGRKPNIKNTGNRSIFEEVFGRKGDNKQSVNLNPDLASLSRAELYERLYKGQLDDRLVEIELEGESSPEVQVITGDSEELGVNFQDILGPMLPKKYSHHKLPVQRAFQMLEAEEAKKLVDGDDIKQAAVELIENQAIIFLDELDKIADREGSKSGPDVSREGVQRDILPIVEGCSVNTKIGPIRTDHILFIAAGAFHETKPSDLIPELQGRFPIRVTLDSLKKEDFKRILTEPKNSLTRQYKELLSTEGVDVEFTDEAIDELASMACQVNEQNENIGARRLHTLLERVLEKISFEAPEMEKGQFVIDRDYVLAELNDICQSRDLSRFIL